MINVRLPYPGHVQRQVSSLLLSAPPDWREPAKSPLFSRFLLQSPQARGYAISAATWNRLPQMAPDMTLCERPHVSVPDAVHLLESLLGTDEAQAFP